MTLDRKPGLEFGVVILAAGASARMGRPKLLLPWGDTTILGHLLEQWRKAGARQLAMVCSEKDSVLRAELKRLETANVNPVVNPRPEEGMFSSVRCAARWTGWRHDLTHWVITLGDQPQVRLETLRALLRFGAAHAESACQPARGGRARHPVLLPADIFRQLRDATEENLKQFLLNRGARRALCEMDDPGLDFDLDQPEDYERALALKAGAPTL